ncbi:GnsA/GnsB family addiction module toxin [Escherichia coli]
MNIEELKNKPKTEIATLSRKKLLVATRIQGKEVSEIRFTAREKMTGLESYDVKIKIM